MRWILTEHEEHVGRSGRQRRFVQNWNGKSTGYLTQGRNSQRRSMMTECLICQTPYQPFMSFGKMPIANGFLGMAEFPQEYFFELEVGFCQKCHMVQLAEQPDREQMF